jgi:hypothetical protein
MTRGHAEAARAAAAGGVRPGASNGRPGPGAALRPSRRRVRAWASRPARPTWSWRRGRCACPSDRCRWRSRDPPVVALGRGVAALVGRGGRRLGGVGLGAGRALAGGRRVGALRLLGGRALGARDGRLAGLGLAAARLPLRHAARGSSSPAISRSAWASAPRPDLRGGPRIPRSPAPAPGSSLHVTSMNDSSSADGPGTRGRPTDLGRTPLKHGQA